jgi:hypothetical protein
LLRPAVKNTGKEGCPVNPIAGLLLLFLSFASTFTGSAPAQNKTAQTAPADESLPLGDWRGDSICVIRESACHDEDSLYHVTRMAEKPGWFSMKLDKIVQGKPELMGTVECSYDAPKQALECVFPKGVLHFTVEGKTMQGVMTLTDKTLWRKLSLKKVGP